jgi:hypothetical protein
MGLFDKYFGQEGNTFDKNQLRQDESIVPYTEKVKYIAWDYFFFEERLHNKERSGYESTINLKRSNIKEFDRLFLLEQEPRIISLIIFGYYVLTEPKFNIKGNKSLISLYENSSLFKSIVLNYAVSVAQNREELVGAMARKVKLNINVDDDYNYKAAIVNRYYFHRFELYSQHVFNGLQEFIENPELSKNRYFDQAFNYYSNPHLDDPKSPNEEVMPTMSFGNYVKRGYLYLKEGKE